MEVQRKLPLQSGPDTEIDLIEHEFGGGVKVEGASRLHEHSVDDRFGGLIAIEEDVEVRVL